MVLDPQTPNPNQKIRFAIRFLRQDLNTAVARELVSCHWHFADDYDAKSGQKCGYRKLTKVIGKTPAAESPMNSDEEGWSVYHYFETRVTSSTLTATFSDSNGHAIELGGDSSWSRRTIELSEDNPAGRWSPLGLEAVQLVATILVPLATLAVTPPAAIRPVTGGSAEVRPPLWQAVCML